MRLVCWQSIFCQQTISPLSTVNVFREGVHLSTNRFEFHEKEIVSIKISQMARLLQLSYRPFLTFGKKLKMHLVGENLKLQSVEKNINYLKSPIYRMQWRNVKLRKKWPFVWKTEKKFFNTLNSGGGEGSCKSINEGKDIKEEL